MLFNSVDFLIFLPIVFLLYWYGTKGNLKLQNILLLVASYFFYACWDWRFLFLLVFSTFLDYFTGLQMFQAQTERLKKFWFWLSICVNLGFLGIFKYYNFFAESFAELLAGFGFQTNFWTLNVILPVGISFYTFHGLSYVIDIYKGRIKPEKNFVDYSVFVSFFPLLVAGPIERATHLLPQIQSKRQFSYEKSVDGLRQILWGLFKKMVIADNCAAYVNMTFDGTEHTGSTYIIGLIFFSFQVYGDFSGYSDIALGTARLFGIELLQNFSFPYFSRDTGEFWRRWHISLSSWFRDYLYIPLGGSSGGTWMQVRNTLIIFTVSGFWHGSAWTFVLWGFMNGVYLLPAIIFKWDRSNNKQIVAYGRTFPTWKELGNMILTFSLITFSFAVFRAIDLEHSWHCITEMFSASAFAKPMAVKNDLVWLIILFILVEWIGRQNKYAIEKMGLRWPRFWRLTFYTIIVLAIFYFKPMYELQFFYFQF